MQNLKEKREQGRIRGHESEILRKADRVRALEDPVRILAFALKVSWENSRGI